MTPFKKALANRTLLWQFEVDDKLKVGKVTKTELVYFAEKMWNEALDAVCKLTHNPDSSIAEHQLINVEAIEKLMV